VTRDISEGRKAAYYFGIVLTILGVLVFLSTFVTFPSRSGTFGNFEDGAKALMFPAVGGMALISIGRIFCHLGSRGLAGSGAVLDPKRAREDLEPYSRMAGGMLKDALDEAGIPLGQADKPAPEKIVQKVVMIKCPACGKLNEEDSKFCQECGHKF